MKNSWRPSFFLAYRPTEKICGRIRSCICLYRSAVVFISQFSPFDVRSIAAVLCPSVWVCVRPSVTSLRAGFKCVEALGRIIIRGPYPPSNGPSYTHLQLKKLSISMFTFILCEIYKSEYAWLSVWSKMQTTLWSTYKLYDLHAIFYSRLSVSKSIFMFPYVIFFYYFCGGPLVVPEAPGQVPSLPPPRLNPALTSLPKRLNVASCRRSRTIV